MCFASHSAAPSSGVLRCGVPTGTAPIWPSCMRWQTLQLLLMSLIQVGTGDFPEAILLIPTLRAHEALLQNLIAFCYYLVAQDCQPLVSLSIMSGFASACNSADLPAARFASTMVRGRANFRHLLMASLDQATLPAHSIDELWQLLTWHLVV